MALGATSENRQRDETTGAKMDVLRTIYRDERKDKGREAVEGQDKKRRFKL